VISPVKRVEIRDRGTFIPAVAFLVSGVNDPLMERAGFGIAPLVVLVAVERPEVQWDVYSWPGRTMRAAHQWLEENWLDFPNGGVLDVEYILGETAHPKTSQVRVG